MPNPVLSRDDVARNTAGLTLLEDLRQALIKGEGALSIPITAVRTEQEGQSILHLHDRSGGQLLAVMDVTGLILLRAQLVAALAVDALASPDAKRVALLGGGPMASGTLKALRLVRSLREVWLVMADPEARVLQAALLQTSLKTPVRAVDAAADAVAQADVVILADAVPLPELALWPSVHLSVPMAQNFSAAPFTPGILAKAWLVSDGSTPLWGHPPKADLGTVLAGTAMRPSEANTIFVGSGPSWLDLVAAWHVFQGI